MVSQNKIWINFKEFKTLPRALSLDLNDMSTSNLPFENYTGYLLSHGLYSKVLLITFKIIHGLCPAYLSSLLQLYQPQRSLRSSSKLLFTVPTVNSATYGERAFSFSAPKNTTSLSSFKSALKTFLFRKLYFRFISCGTVPSFQVT